MAILADGSSYLDRYVEGVIEAEGFAASRRLLFLHLTLSGPRRLSRSSGMCSWIGSVTTLSKLGESPREEAAGTQQMRSRVPFALRTVQSFFCRAERESLTGRALVPLGGDFAAESSRWIQETDSESIAMETLYDLLGALPNDDTDELRAAFRRAVKRVHPDINSEDLDAGLKFRRIVRANEILGDAEQRAAYDHLLALAHHEQEQAAKQAAGDKVHKVASGVMALAGISVVAVGGYALWPHPEARPEIRFCLH